MLKERFEFCGEWQVGPGGLCWYTPELMDQERAYLLGAVRENLDAYGEICRLQNKAVEELTVLAETDFNLITAYWGAGGVEPTIQVHHGSNAEEFGTLLECLAWYAGIEVG